MNTESTKRALIIVDVQNDFCPGGALAVPRGDEVVGPINRIVPYAIAHDWKIFASRDWHPALTTHFAICGGKWPVHCVRGTRGAEFHPALRLPAHALIVSKGMGTNENAYSAFYGRAHESTDAPETAMETLHEALQRNHVREVYMCGLATDYCVKETALDAVNLGYTVYLLADACKAVNVNSSDGQQACNEMDRAGVFITTTGEIINT